jgi:hypothetical protein
VERRRIPHGEALTRAALSHRLGVPGAARAVAEAATEAATGLRLSTGVFYHSRALSVTLAACMSRASSPGDRQENAA